MNQGPQGAAPSAPPPFSPPPPTQPADTVGPPRVVVQRQPPQPCSQASRRGRRAGFTSQPGRHHLGEALPGPHPVPHHLPGADLLDHPVFSDDGDKGINGNLAGQAQGAPGPTSSGGGSGPQPTTSPPPNNPSPSTPLNNGGAKNDLLSDSERLSGGPCTGSAVDRMTYYFPRHVQGRWSDQGGHLVLLRADRRPQPANWRFSRPLKPWVERRSSPSSSAPSICTASPAVTPVRRQCSSRMDVSTRWSTR
jgi:hypothetical protein